MKSFFKQLIVISFVMLLPLAALAASPGWQPTTNIEIIAGAGPGSVHDRLARIVLQLVREEFSSIAPMIVVNRPGAGGAIALGYLDRNPGNAHFLSTATGTLLTSYLTGNTKFNYADYPLLSLPFNDYAVFTVKSDSPIKSGKDLLEKLKADPKSVSFAYASSPGNYNHIAIAGVAKAANVNPSQILTIVHTGGGGKAMIDVLGGHVDVLVGSVGNVVGQLNAGRLRVIAVAAPQRYEAPALAHIPTWIDQGVNIIADTPYFFLAPKALKQEQIEFWERTFARMYKRPEWREFTVRNNVVPIELNHAEAKKYLKERYDSYFDSIQELGLTKKH